MLSELSEQKRLDRTGLGRRGDEGMEMSQDRTLSEFFACLDAGDAATTAQFFAPDGLYVRPAADTSGGTGTSTDVIRGREAICDYFRLRGRRPYRHQVEYCVRAVDLVYGDGVAIHEITGPFA